MAAYVVVGSCGPIDGKEQLSCWDVDLVGIWDRM